MFFTGTDAFAAGCSSDGFDEEEDDDDDDDADEDCFDDDAGAARASSDDDSDGSDGSGDPGEPTGAPLLVELEPSPLSSSLSAAAFTVVCVDLTAVSGGLTGYAPC